MSKLSDAANGTGGCLFLVCQVTAVLLHLFFCYFAYLSGSFLSVLLTFSLPVLSEIYWLIDAYRAVGFFWLHYIFFGWLLLIIFAFILMSLDGSRAEAGKRRKEMKRKQEFEAERAACETAVRARSEAEFSPAVAAAIANRQVIDQKIAEQRAVQAPVIISQQPVSQEEQLRRRAELAERRCQELSAELREQKEKSQADILTVQIEELERSLAMSLSLPADGIADLEQQLMEKKARLFDLQRKQQ